MEEKKLICVNCPMGCEVTVQKENDEILSVSGNRCPRGEAYARQEMIEPMRILTTTVRIENGIHRVIPVISEKEIPLRCMFDAMEVIRHIRVTGPIQQGDIICENICDTGVNIIAARSM